MIRTAEHFSLFGLGLPGEVDVPGEHGGDARDLLLLVHHEVAGRVGLEVERDLEEREDCECSAQFNSIH